MKRSLVKLARTLITWNYDLLKLVDAHLFFLEHGKTQEQVKREAVEQLTRWVRIVYTIPRGADISAKSKDKVN